MGCLPKMGHRAWQEQDHPMSYIRHGGNWDQDGRVHTLESEARGLLPVSLSQGEGPESGQSCLLPRLLGPLFYSNGRQSTQNWTLMRWVALRNSFSPSLLPTEGLCLSPTQPPPQRQIWSSKSSRRGKGENYFIEGMEV